MHKYFEMKKILTLITIIALWSGVAPAAGRYKGDLNADDKVDMADMVFLANAIKNGTSDKDCDINSSGKVDDHDLDALANIIISKTLTENDGFNVGIGDWDDSGEDYGGTVNAPAYPGTRSAEATRFYIDNPKEDGDDDKYSIEFGIEEADVTASAFLFNIKLPNELSFDENNIVTLNESAYNGHRLYGKPKIQQPDKWGDKILRFIVFSPDLNPVNITKGVLGQLHYNCINEGGHVYEFSECQIVTSESNNVVVPEISNYWTHWKPVAVGSVTLNPSYIDVYVNEEYEIRTDIQPWDATDRTLTWQSSDESVVSISYVSEDGSYAWIMARKEGAATVTATASNGVSDSCLINVTDIDSVDVMIDSKPFKVFDVNGHLILNSDDRRRLETLPQGIYIIVQEGKNIKFAR